MSGPMGIVYPTQGGTADTWGTALNAALSLVENHDHTSGKGVQIPSAGIGINADLGFAAYAITSLKAAAYTGVAPAAVAGYASALFVSNVDNNLYFRNSGGTNVQLTNGATINISLVGGIGGDYSAAGALLQYVDASKDYFLQQEGTPRPWAGIQTGDIKLFEKAASISNFIGLKSPHALAGSYTLTMPGALPAGNAMVQLDNTGALSFSNTFLTAPTSSDYKINGSGLTLSIPIQLAQVGTTNTIAAGSDGFDHIVMGVSGSDIITFGIPLRVGDEIISWKVYLNKTTDATNTISAKLWYRDATSATLVEDFAKTNSANNPGYITLSDSGLTHTIAAGQAWHLGVWHSAGAAALDFVMLVEVTYVRP